MTGWSTVRFHLSFRLLPSFSCLDYGTPFVSKPSRPRKHWKVGENTVKLPRTQPKLSENTTELLRTQSTLRENTEESLRKQSWSSRKTMLSNVSDVTETCVFPSPFRLSKEWLQRERSRHRTTTSGQFESSNHTINGYFSFVFNCWSSGWSYPIHCQLRRPLNRGTPSHWGDAPCLILRNTKNKLMQTQFKMIKFDYLNFVFF